MKTIAELNALIPQLIQALWNNIAIGYSYTERDEDGWSTINDYEGNYVYFEKDGIEIELDFDIAGDGDDRFWGKINSLDAYYTNEDGEVIYFEDDDLKEVTEAILNEIDCH